VPKASDYVVAKGDTVYGLSRRFGVDMSSLVRENNIPAPYKIRIGQVLRLPAPVVQSASAVGTGMATTEVGLGVPPVPSPSAPVSSLPASSGGNSLDVTGPAPISAPTTASSIDVAPLAPPTKAGGVAGAAPTAPAKTAAEPSLGVSIPAKPAAAAVQANIPVPAPRADSRFLWPIHGKIVSAFGVKQGGLHNDGINIEAPRGTVVRAAENGVVVYAGNELRGFGNLLLIKHADGWTTAYAHNEQILVQRGEQVKRGQPVAKVGATGNVTTPQLHFELREGTEAVDPVRYLGSQSAENGGAG
jgi:murein DD-endopeptidase MepM/ murein hydrolase activator NlpD